MHDAVAEAERVAGVADADVVTAERVHHGATDTASAEVQTRDRAHHAEVAHALRRSGFFARLFRTGAARDLATSDAQLVEALTLMLGYLPPETLDWLLVDEAGQAVQQAAIGVITRTRRAVVVGDPLQIELVSSLPTELSETICADFGIDPEWLNAGEASAQAVADASATYFAKFRQTVGSVRVGFPLLVHRRYADPMFNPLKQGRVPGPDCQRDAARDVRHPRRPGGSY